MKRVPSIPRKINFYNNYSNNEIINEKKPSSFNNIINNINYELKSYILLAFTIIETVYTHIYKIVNTIFMYFLGAFIAFLFLFILTIIIDNPGLFLVIVVIIYYLLP